MAGAGGFLADVNDHWLKPRLLRAVVGERLPQPGGDVPPAELASILDAVRMHGLLTESLPDSPDPKLAEAWRAAVDVWVQRVGELVETDSPYSCWLGTCFLGVTFQECSNERFGESYSNWFQKILRNLQEPSSLQLVTVVSCTSMSDLFVRLAKFLNLKKEASSFAGRVVEPVLLLLNENGPVADEAINLLRTVIKLFPSAVNRHYNKVESAIAARVMSTEVNVKPSEKFAKALALLPSVRVSEDSWSLMIQKILIVVNNLLNEAFLGLEEEKNGHEIMVLLVPPGNDPPPMLGDQISSGGNVHVTKKFRVCTVPTISALVHCCCVMLTSYYPVQVNVPVRALIALIRRVLLVDGSLHKKLFPSTTSLHQELICFELPSLHSTFLDLLSATIKGMRSQLLPHAANIVRLITEFFKIAKLPTMRTKVYNIVQLLLTSMGVGMSLHLLEVIVSNAVGDLDDSCGNNVTLFSTDPSKVTIESSSKSYSKKRKQESQMQNSHASGSEKAAISPKKRKSSSIPTTSKGMTPETTADGRMLTPLSIKIAALETLEILLNVGGSLRTDHWRTEVDLLLINIARSACDTGGGYEKKPSTVGEPSISDFQLASLKALLASFLSSSHARPPYLAQGIELFRRGKLDIGTRLAEFCSRALLALDVLTHPRALSLERAGPIGPGLNYGAPEKAVFGAGKYKFSPSGDQRQAMVDEDMYDDWLASTKDDEPTETLVKDGPEGKDTAVEISRDENQSALIKEYPQIGSPSIPEAIQDVSTSGKSDVKMVDAVAEETAKLNTMVNPSNSSAVSAPVYTMLSDPQKPAAAPVFEKRIDHAGHLQNKAPTVDASPSNPGTSGEAPIAPVGASSSHQAPEGPSTRLTQPSKTDLSDAESEDSMPDIVDADPDSDYKRVSGFDQPPQHAIPIVAPGAATGQQPAVPPAIPGMLPNMFNFTPGQFNPLVIQPQAMTQQATRHARRVYVGGLPPTANEQTVAIFFNQAMSAIGGNTAGPGHAVLNVYINHDKKFAFVEMRSVEEASNAMALDGIMFEGAPVKVRRPTDYNPSLAAALGPSQPNPNLNLAAAGLTPSSAGGLEGPDRIFVGGLPYYFTEAQVRELLESFGPLRGFDLVKDRETGNSKGYAFCIYQDLTVTDIACAALNGIKMGDKTLTVRRANQGAAQPRPEQESVLLQAQQQVQMQTLVYQVGGSLPTKVVCLTQVVSADELRDDEEYEDIVEDMREEGRRYGNLVKVVIPRPDPSGAPVAGVGKVFLEYADVDGSTKAKMVMHGRRFGGNHVVAVFYPENKLAVGEYDG